MPKAPGTVLHSLRAALMLWDLPSPPLPTAQVSNYQTWSNKLSLSLLAPNSNMVKKTGLEMETIFHKEFN